MLNNNSLSFQLESKIVKSVLKIQEHKNASFNEAIVDFSQNVKNLTGANIILFHLTNWLNSGTSVPQAKMIALSTFLGFPIHLYKD